MVFSCTAKILFFTENYKDDLKIFLHYVNIFCYFSMNQVNNSAKILYNLAYCGLLARNSTLPRGRQPATPQKKGGPARVWGTAL